MSPHFRIVFQPFNSISSYPSTHLWSDGDTIFGFGTWELLIILGAIFVAFPTYCLVRQKRIDDFKANYDSLSYNRSMYSDNMLRAYLRANGKDGLGQELETGAHLLKPALGDGSTWDLPVDISMIKLEPVFEHTDFRGVSYIGGRMPSIRFWMYRCMSLPNPFRLYSYNTRRYKGKKVFNGELYHIIGVEANGRSITIHVGLSNYYSYYNSCEILTFISVCRQNRVLEGRWSPRDSMKLRMDGETSKLLIDIGNFDNRCVGIGVCTLTVLYGLADQSGMFFLVHHRSDKVSEAMNTMSLVPAGTLQPNNGTEDVEIARLDVYFNIMREFEEEVLGRKEAEFMDRFTDEPVDGMREYYLTMGFDPLTTKMEMITMLTIDCSSPDVIGLIGRLVPEVADHPLDRTTIADILKRHASSEGSITIEPFTRTNIERFENYCEAMPLFRECMRYVGRNFDTIEMIIREGPILTDSD